MTSLTDGKGQTKTFTYDVLDRLTGITFAGGATVTYAYDADGSLTSRGDNTGTTSFTYDPLNRMTKKTFPDGSTMTYGYDSSNNLTTLADASGTTTYAYDSVNVTTAVTDPAGAKTTFGHDGDYRRTSTTYPNGVAMTQSYDKSGRLQTIESKNTAGTLLTSFTYSYSDPVTGKDTGVRQSVTDKNGNKTSYGYDPLGRLKSATTTDAAGTTTDARSYTYDGNGNRLSQTVNGSSTSYSYNSANQLTQAGSTTYSYDANGNMTGNSAGLAVSYNSKDQTTSITPSGGPAFNMVYADANQTERTSAGATSYASGLLGVQSEKTGTTTTSYLRDEKGKLVSQRVGMTAYYYLFDGLGSVVGLTDSSGTLVNSYKYDPWGQDLGGSRQVSNPWRFASGYFDSTSGLYKFAARYYDPSLGRWTQHDPLSGNIGNPTTLNRYVYAKCDPVNATDPSGLATCDFADYVAMYLGVSSAIATEAAMAVAVAAGIVTGPFGWLALAVVTVSTGLATEVLAAYEAAGCDSSAIQI